MRLLFALLMASSAAAQTTVDALAYRVRVTTRLPSLAGAEPVGGPMVIARGTSGEVGGRIDFQAVEPLPGGLTLEDYLIRGDSGRVLTVLASSRAVRDGSPIVSALRNVTAGGAMGIKAAVKIGNPAKDVSAKDGGAVVADPLGKSATAAMNQIRDVKVDVEDLGAGEAMEGRATRHYRVAISYTRFQGTNTQPVKMLVEAWTTELPLPLFNPFDPLGSGFYSLTGSSVELDAKVAAARKQLRGVPIRTITTVVGLDQLGAPNGFDVVQTMQLTGFQSAKVDPGMLRVPR